jgi:hypothetical protein
MADDQLVDGLVERGFRLDALSFIRTVYATGIMKSFTASAFMDNRLQLMVESLRH